MKYFTIPFAKTKRFLNDFVGEVSRGIRILFAELFVGDKETNFPLFIK